MEGRKPTRRRGDFAAPVGKSKSLSDADGAIVNEMRKMLDEGIYLTDEGKPDTEALSDRLQFRVSAKVRDRLMKEL